MTPEELEEKRNEVATQVVKAEMDILEKTFGKNYSIAVSIIGLMIADGRSLLGDANPQKKVGYGQLVKDISVFLGGMVNTNPVDLAKRAIELDEKVYEAVQKVKDDNTFDVPSVLH